MIRILVIEPEAAPRHALRNILEDAGYDVEVAADGANAAHVHAQHPADLVIADLVDVAPHHDFAGTRVLALPGGLARPESERTRPALHSLPKPFRRDDLLAAVRQTLDMALPV